MVYGRPNRSVPCYPKFSRVDIKKATEREQTMYSTGSKYGGNDRPVDGGAKALVAEACWHRQGWVSVRHVRCIIFRLLIPPHLRCTVLPCAWSQMIPAHHVQRVMKSRIFAFKDVPRESRDFVQVCVSKFVSKFTKVPGSAVNTHIPATRAPSCLERSTPFQRVTFPLRLVF